MPIFPASSYKGYDVTEYYNVNPDYGTLDDFKRLLDEAHKRGIRVIIDLALNQTSSENPGSELPGVSIPLIGIGISGPIRIRVMSDRGVRRSGIRAQAMVFIMPPSRQECLI